MKYLRIARRNLKRLKTIDCAFIALFDLATIGLFALIGMFFLSTIKRSAFFLSKVVASAEIMATNRAITELNLSLFEQATTTFVGGVITIAIVASIIYAILNYVQWSRVAEQKLSKRKAFQYVGFQSTFILGFLTTILLSYIFLLDADRVGYSITIYLAIGAHLIMGSHLGLLKKGLKFHWKKIPDFVIKVLSGCFNKLWQWAIVYGLFFLILVIGTLLWATLFQFGTIGHVLSAVFCLGAFAWWRMVTYDLLTT